MNAIRTLVNRQPLKVTGSMRSPRGFFAALILLCGIPIALLGQVVFGINVEISLHFVFALTAGLVALAVFDFKLPWWMTWLGSVSSGALATIFLLQGVSLLIPNDMLHYVAYTVLGQQLEAALLNGLILWFIALLLGDSQGKTRLFGCAALTLAVGSELYRLGMIYLGAEPSALLKLTMLLPFVWLLLESNKRLEVGK